MAHKMMNKTAGTLLLGAALGYAASLFFSSDTRSSQRVKVERKARELKALLTDPEEQQRVKDIFDESTSKTRNTYHDAKSKLIASLAGLRGGIQEIDKQKYVYTLDKIMNELRENRELPKKQFEKLRNYLTEDFQKLKNNVALD